MNKSSYLNGRVIAVVAALAMLAFTAMLLKSLPGKPAGTSTSPEPSSASNTSVSETTVDLTPSQLNAVKIEAVGTHLFSVDKEACGTVAYSGTDLSTKWIMADVTESDIPLVHLKQEIKAMVGAYPGRVFGGEVSALGGSVYDAGGNPAIDPNTRRVVVRCEVQDPQNELYPGMLASVLIRVQAPVESVAIPMNGAVRNGDGTMAVWVTTDHHRFSQRIIKIGLQIDDQYQVLEGLQSGELAVTDGAIFLNNILYAPPDD